MFLAVATSVFAVAVDRLMLASKDFGFMLAMGTGTLLIQLFQLHRRAKASRIRLLFLLLLHGVSTLFVKKSTVSRS